MSVQQLHKIFRGPRGGCYKITSSGNKRYIKSPKKILLPPETRGLPFIPLKRKRSQTSFRGSQITTIAMMLYLAAKHKNECIPILSEARVLRWHGCDLWDMDLQSGISWAVWYSSKQDKVLDTQLITAKNLRDTIVHKCENKRFLLIPIQIKTRVDAKCRGHQNLILLDRINKTAERFEPHGTPSASFQKKSSLDLFNHRLKEFFLALGYIYLEPAYLCPALGPQIKQEREHRKGKVKGKITGFCVAWTFWYADLRMTYPDILQPDLIVAALEAIEASPVTLTEYIISYASFFENITKEHINNPGWLDHVIAELTSD